MATFACFVSCVVYRARHHLRQGIATIGAIFPKTFRDHHSTEGNKSNRSEEKNGRQSSEVCRILEFTHFPSHCARPWARVD